MIRQPTNLGIYGYTKFQAVPTWTVKDLFGCFTSNKNWPHGETTLTAERLDATLRSTLTCALRTYDMNDDMALSPVKAMREIHLRPMGAVAMDAKKVGVNPRFGWHIGTNYMTSDITEENFDVYVNMGNENVLIWVVKGSHMSWVNESLHFAASDGIGHRICPLVFNASSYCAQSERVVLKPGEMLVMDSRLIRQECKECTLGSSGALVFYSASLKESPEQKLPEPVISLSDTYGDLLQAKESEWNEVVQKIYTELSG